MSRFKFFGFLLPFAMAGGLALGLVAVPAMADPPPHSHGGGAISDADPPWAVTMSDLGVDGTAVVLSCLGTPVQNKDTLAADFERGCTISMTPENSDETIGGIDRLSLFRMGVREKGSGDTEIWLFFTTNPDFSAGDNAEVWAADSTVVDRTDHHTDGSITLTLPNGCGALDEVA